MRHAACTPECRARPSARGLVDQSGLELGHALRVQAAASGRRWSAASRAASPSTGAASDEQPDSSSSMAVAQPSRRTRSSSAASALGVDDRGRGQRLERGASGRQVAPPNASSTLPTAVQWYGTRRPTHWPVPRKCRLSTCARCSTPSGLGDREVDRLPARLGQRVQVRLRRARRAVASRVREAQHHRARARSCRGGRAAARGPGARARRAGARRCSWAARRRRPARPAPRGSSASSTSVSSCAARSIVCVPGDGVGTLVPYGIY